MKKLIFLLLVTFSFKGNACNDTLVHLYDSVCYGKSYLFNDINRTFSGNYRDTLPRVGGCDSFIIMHLYVTPWWLAPQSEIFDTICTGDSLFFNNQWRKNSGSYAQTIQLADSCDSLVILRLTVWAPFRWPPINDTTCRNDPKWIGGAWRKTTGVYADTLKGAGSRGCDSVTYIRLQVYDTSVYTTLPRDVCNGTPYFFKGQNHYGFPDSVIEIWDTLKNRRNCDSVVILQLRNNKIDSTYINATICDNQTYLFDGLYLSSSGNYRAVIKQKNNTCDSFLFLTLTVNKTSRSTQYHKACSNNPRIFNGVPISSSGTYYDTLTNAVGCDSFLVLHLYIDSANIITINDTICSNDSILFKKMYIKTAGTYRDTIKNALGCDSMITLNLSQYPSKTLSVTSNVNLLQATQGFYTYQWYFNDAFLSNQNRFYIQANKSGNFTVESRDSNWCYYKSSNFNHTFLSIHNSSNLIEIYPNPAKDFIQISSSELAKGSIISVYSLDGKCIQTLEHKDQSKTEKINTSQLTKGIYLLDISINGVSTKTKFVKE